MSSWRLTVQPYAVPLRRPLETAYGSTTLRRGALVSLIAPDGTIGHGELACLPQQPVRYLQDALQLLAACAFDLHNGTPPETILNHWARWDEAGTAARAALETALLDLRARQYGCSLAELLTPTPRPSIAVNAVITASDCDATATAAAAARDAGYRVIKLKVGMAARGEEEIARVAAVRAAIGPDIALRLDANGAWTPEQAITMLRRLADYNLALVEQPVPAWDIEGLARVRRSVSVPIAADEAVTSREAVEQLCVAEAVDALVLKLPVVGGITVAHALAELAARHQCAIVVTSVFETGIGLAAAMHTAAAVPGELLACGLATASSLVTTLVTGLPEPVHGQLAIPHDEPGLGVALDKEALRFCADLMEDRHAITHASD